MTIQQPSSGLQHVAVFSQLIKSSLEGQPALEFQTTALTNTLWVYSLAACMREKQSAAITIGIYGLSKGHTTDRIHTANTLRTKLRLKARLKPSMHLWISKRFSAAPLTRLT
jgi:hypothetical protein